MKSFKKFVAEVAEPKSGEEKRFKDQHNAETIPHPVAPESQHKAVKPKAKRKADQEGDANYDQAYTAESVDTEEDEEPLQEISKKLAGRYIKKAQIDTADAADKVARSYDAYDKKQGEKQRKAGIAKIVRRRMGTHDAVSKLTGTARVAAKEDASLDRARYDAADDKDKKKVTLPKAPWEKKKAVNEITQSATKKPVTVTGPDGKVRTVLRKKAVQKDDNGQDVMGTRVESNQLDELSPSLLKRYQKKADKAAGKAYDKYGEHEMEHDGPKGKTAKGRAEIDRKMDKAMATGDKRHAGAMLARKKLIAKGHKSPKMSYESSEQIDEISKELAGRYMKKAMPQYKRAQTKQHVGGYGSTTQKGADANKERLRKRHKGIGSVHKRQGGSEVVDRNPARNSMTGKKAPYQYESVQYIDEAVKAGNMKLRDGSSIKVTKEDAKLLNQMFKDLNSQNRKQMEKVMMTDKNGFNEIVGFAREAL